MRIDLSRFRVRASEQRRAVDNMIEELRRNDDVAYISDAIISDGACELLMAELRRDQTPKYKLKVLCDEWGQMVKPGDIVRRRYSNPLTIDGKLITSTTINHWMRQGIYDEKMYYYKNYIVDEKGCITCTCEDAEIFLMTWGVHGISDYKISSHVDEHSEPIKTKDGFKSVHYWRYKEVDAEMYEALPLLTTETEAATTADNTTESPKRLGRPPKTKDQTNEQPI